MDLAKAVSKQTREDIDELPPPLKVTPLYYATFYGSGDVARRLFVTHKEM